jgi:hypothetical protein
MLHGLRYLPDDICFFGILPGDLASKRRLCSISKGPQNIRYHPDKNQGISFHEMGRADTWYALSMREPSATGQKFRKNC